jgi:hypothetical protein
MKTKPQLSARAKEQERIDDQLMRGHITKEQWRILADDLSSNWDANGRIRPTGDGK